MTDTTLDASKATVEVDTSKAQSECNGLLCHFNNLSPAETERLALVMEECAEVIQVIGKILRHGYASYNPFDEKKTTNRELLEMELGHFGAASSLLIKNNDVNWRKCDRHDIQKQDSVKQWLHHQEA